MKVVALLTDFGLQDNYVGVMKGVILKINPAVQIIDISHSVASHNITEAAFLLASSFSYFPQETVFLVVVDPGVGSIRQPVAIQTKNYYFVGPDNGSLSLAARKDGIKKVTVLKNKKYFLKNISSTFHGRDIFAPCAAHISKGISLSSLGTSTQKIKNLHLPSPVVKEGKLIGTILYKDKFGNLLTNITKSQFHTFLGKGNFSAVLKAKKIRKICSFYSQAKKDEPFFIEASTPFLEISLKNGSASEYFTVKKGQKPTFIVNLHK
ncbi:MAG: SAM-dependent chlorinase/fluorinase [Candidatus Omnitrophota bacterium]|nr:MAG: SAM-dependent chlorinase/fluorinase [Candidatus Omnitrophota bacterium]